jgi:hypothetical protein
MANRDRFISLFPAWLLGGGSQGGYRDDAYSFAVGCGEDLWEGLEGAGWVGDGVVEDDDCAGGDIFLRGLS